MQRTSVSWIVSLLIPVCLNCAYATGKPADPAETLKQAQQLVDTRQLSEAVPLLRQVVSSFPESVEAASAQLKLGYVQITLGDKAAAQAEFDKLVPTYPHSPLVPEALYRSASLRFAAKDYLEAATKFSEVIKHAPNEFVASARTMRAKCALEVGNVTKALPDLAAAAVEGVATGKHFEAQRMLAEVYLQNKSKLGELSEEVKAALPDALYLASDVYLNKREKPQEAIPFLLELVSSYPDYKKRSGALFWLGAAYIRTGQYDKARETYSEIIEKYPEKDHAIGAQQELVRLALDDQKDQDVLLQAEKLFQSPHDRAKIYAILSYWRATQRLGLKDPRPLEMIDEMLRTPGLEQKWIAECEGLRDMILRVEQTIASPTAEMEPVEPVLVSATDALTEGWKYSAQVDVIEEHWNKGESKVALKLAEGLVRQCAQGLDRDRAKRYLAQLYARLNRFDEAYEILGLDE